MGFPRLAGVHYDLANEIVAETLSRRAVSIVSAQLIRSHSLHPTASFA
jgi:hypothetical protein